MSDKAQSAEFDQRIFPALKSGIYLVGARMGAGRIILRIDTELIMTNRNADDEDRALKIVLKSVGVIAFIVGLIALYYSNPINSTWDYFWPLLLAPIIAYGASIVAFVYYLGIQKLYNLLRDGRIFIPIIAILSIIGTYISTIKQDDLLGWEILLIWIFVPPVLGFAIFAFLSLGAIAVMYICTIIGVSINKWKLILGISIAILLCFAVILKFAPPTCIQQKEQHIYSSYIQQKGRKELLKEKQEEIKKATVKVREYDYREYSFREYVYISTGRYAKRFHTNPRCKGLIKSKHVIEVSLDDAEFSYHMTPCQYCCLSYEDDIYDDNRKISWRRIQLVFSLTDDQINRLKNIAEKKRIKTTSIYEYVGGGYSVDEIINDLKNI